MTNQHPYPAHVVEAVAEQLTAIFKPFSDQVRFKDMAESTQDVYRRNASMALTALWEASRVDTIEQLEALPNDAIVIDSNGFWIETVLEAPSEFDDEDYPAHVIYWGGGSDE